MIIQTNEWECPRDPDLFICKGNYYICFVKENCLYLKKSSSLEGLKDGEIIKIYEPKEDDEYRFHTWAPEVHIIDGTCYIYTTMNKDKGDPQRMFVLTNDSDDVEKPFHKVGFIDDGNEQWGIDATILRHEGKLYYVWSAFGGYDGKFYQALYINEMESPIKLKPGRYLLSKSEYDWELERGGRDVPFVNEGPFAVYHDDKPHIIYSASGCWTNFYCLGQLTFNGGDILNKDNWTKNPHPILAPSETLKGPGHASFLQNDPSGIEYMAFHAFVKDDKKGEGDVFSAVIPYKWENGLIVPDLTRIRS